MIGKHCGQYTRAESETRLWFTRRCVVCRRVFAQRKRQPNQQQQLPMGGNDEDATTDSDNPAEPERNHR